MPRIAFDVAPENRSVVFPNGTSLVGISAYGTATQFTPAGRGLRSADLPSEIDTSPLFDRALAEAGLYEQETIHLEALPATALRSDSVDDTIVLRPAIPPGDTDPRVVLYEDDSGGLSWHFAEGALLTQEDRERLERRGLLREARTPEFVIPGRTSAARDSLSLGPPRGALRGFITKIGRKVLKVLVIPLGGRVLENPVQLFAGAIESRVRSNRVWQLTADNYTKGPDGDFTNWKSLDGKLALLVVHGLFSSAEGMLGQLPRSAMERWLNHYERRVIAFNHLSVTLSPEENARFFLERAKQNLPHGKFQFDILCHSRGGIVSRGMVERGHDLVADTNCSFRKVYFVASPNAGSALGDPEHMVDMLDVFTNLFTEFPDGHVLYAIETVLGIVKLLAYTAEKYLPGVESMGTRSYIAQVLNKATQPSPARYAAAASGYIPQPGVDNGFFTGRFATYIMDQIFKKNGHELDNDLVVPRNGVFSGNGHPSFPIVNPLLYRGADGVWHGGFFSQQRTLAHIDKFLEIEGGDYSSLRDQIVAGDRSGLRGLGTGEAVAPEPAAMTQREPSIEFHEVVFEGVPNDLIVRLSDVAEAAEVKELIEIEFGAGEERIQVLVELSAPGFTIVGERTAGMVIKRPRDPKTEEVTFTLVAKRPGEKPATRKIIASFFRGSDCIGGVTHLTEVVPAGYTGSITSAGVGTSDRVAISSRPREDVDLVIYVREAQSDTFEMMLRSNILGEEYAMRDMGTLKLAGTEFADFFSKTIDPQFQSFPSNPKLTDAQFDGALAVWSGKFLTSLADLGRKLWNYLPQTFRNEYLRLMCLPMPPRSICVFSDEMVLPWELVRPSGLVNANFLEYPPMGVLHIMGRWKPELGARPQPQALRVEKMALLTPQYDGKPLYWAQKESEELCKLIVAIDQPSTVDRKTLDAMLDGTGVQVVHFNGHGNWNTSSDLTALQLANDESIPAMAFASRKLGMMAHPILYLNACSVGRIAMNVGKPGGFAANCLDGGWSGIIAPYWRVYDRNAMQFGVKLYRKLKAGTSIGEALQQIRRDDPNDFTAQSYAYFGDPNARVLLR
jgi:hypothetical protein